MADHCEKSNEFWSSIRSWNGLTSSSKILIYKSESNTCLNDALLSRERQSYRIMMLQDASTRTFRKF